MFDTLIKNLQTTHLALLVYVVLFIGPILSSIIFALTLIFLWINLIIFPLMSSQLKQSYKVYFLGIDLGKRGFSIGKLINQIQKLVADFSNIKLLEKVNIHSIQKKITNWYLDWVSGVFRVLENLFKESKNQGDTNLEDFGIVKNIVYYIIGLLMSTLMISIFIILICFPVIILVILIYRII